MPSKYPVMTPFEIINKLKKFGFVIVSQKGSHIKMSNSKRTAIIPNHSEVAKGTLRSILLQAGISLDDFLAA